MPQVKTNYCEGIKEWKRTNARHSTFLHNINMLICMVASGVNVWVHSYAYPAIHVGWSNIAARSLIRNEPILVCVCLRFFLHVGIVSISVNEHDHKYHCVCARLVWNVRKRLTFQSTVDTRRQTQWKEKHTISFDRNCNRENSLSDEFSYILHSNRVWWNWVGCAPHRQQMLKSMIRLLHSRYYKLARTKWRNEAEND